jgi:putative colanic acid biosynthesis UDP-glucose lipid carrier transferase
MSPSTIIFDGVSTSSNLKPKKLLRKHESLLLIFQVSLSCLVVSVALVICTLLKIGDVPSLYRLLLIISVFLVVAVYSMMGVFKQSPKFYNMAMRISLAWLLLMAVLIIIAFLTKTSELYSREVMLTWFFSVAIVQIPVLKLNYYAVALYRKKYTRPINAVVIGVGKTARFFSNKINDNYWLPDRVLGMINGYQETVPDTIYSQLRFPLLGGISEIEDVIKTHNIQRIYISLPLKHAAKVEQLNERLLDCQADVIWILDVSDWKLMNHSLREVAGLPLLSLNESPINVSRVQIRMKHALDKMLSILLVILLLPLLAIAALAVKISSPGPIIFKQKRHGYDGEEISIYKFRSMRLHDDKDVKQATKTDNRITTVGAFLRRSSIDELPQLFNVLEGNMSLVGPRPHALAHNDYYSVNISKYMARHRIKPGITGLAQISGCRGETETIEKMEARVRYDIEYISNWSLWLDMKILLKTPLSLIGKEIY